MLFNLVRPMFFFAGPEIRTGLLKGGGSAEVELVKGEEIKLSLNDTHSKSGTSSMIYVDYKNLCKVISIGSKVSILPEIVNYNNRW